MAYCASHPVAGVLAVLMIATASPVALAQVPPESASLKAFAESLPGVMAKPLHAVIMLTAPDGKGNEITVARTTRAAGTRTPLHTHDYGGTTCVLSGQMTLYREHHTPQTADAGQCYYMPAGSVMAGDNVGKTRAVMLDFFDAPKGQPVWTVVEPQGSRMQNQFDPHQ